jgi:hypothetical protein
VLRNKTEVLNLKTRKTQVHLGYLTLKIKYETHNINVGSATFFVGMCCTSYIYC